MEPNTEILSRLKFLSHIQKGDKISSRNMTLQMDCWTTRITRTWVTPDNRANTLKLIREIISRSFEILANKLVSKKESDLIECKNIISDLNKAKAGLLNLKTTYDTDIKFGCDLDILLQQISAKITELQKDNVFLREVDPLQTVATVLPLKSITDDFPVFSAPVLNGPAFSTPATDITEEKV